MTACVGSVGTGRGVVILNTRTVSCVSMIRVRSFVNERRDGQHIDQSNQADVHLNVCSFRSTKHKK
jgi:hypothetical protein